MAVMTPRSAPKPEPNPLTDSPSVIPWLALEAYFKEVQERVIFELSNAAELKDLWRAQGQLALLDELANLRTIIFVLDSSGKT